MGEGAGTNAEILWLHFYTLGGSREAAAIFVLVRVWTDISAELGQIEPAAFQIKFKCRWIIAD